MNRNLLYGFLLLVIAGACVSEFNATIPTSEIDILVVEGNIISDSTVEFYFSKSFSLDEAAPPAGYDEVHVELAVIGSDGYRSSPAVYQGRGVHQLTIGKLNGNAMYGIEFKYEGDTYQSELTKPIHTPVIDSISFTQPGELGDVSIRVSTHDKSPEYRYFMWTYKEDWEITANYSVSIFFDPDNESFYLDPTIPYYYCWRQHQGTEILIGSTETLTENSIINKALYKYPAGDDRFSVLYSTLIKQQAISKNAYEYYQDKLKSNEGMGGIFTPQPSKIEGNISCITDPAKKVIGYVDVADNVVESRFFLRSTDVSRPGRGRNCGVLTSDSVAKILRDLDITYTEFYYRGYRPLTYTDMGGIAPDDWTTLGCTDCRQIGGSKTKPSFWPNNHQ